MKLCVLGPADNTAERTARIVKRAFPELEVYQVSYRGAGPHRRDPGGGGRHPLPGQGVLPALREEPGAAGPLGVHPPARQLPAPNHAGGAGQVPVRAQQHQL